MTFNCFCDHYNVIMHKVIHSHYIMENSTYIEPFYYTLMRYFWLLFNKSELIKGTETGNSKSNLDQVNYVILSVRAPLQHRLDGHSCLTITIHWVITIIHHCSNSQVVFHSVMSYPRMTCFRFLLEFLLWKFFL